MKKSRFIDEQIVQILEKAEDGTSTIEALCRKHSISEHTFYR